MTSTSSKQGSTKMTWNLGTNQELDVVGNYTVDATGDIILDADGRRALST